MAKCTSTKAQSDQDCHNCGKTIRGGSKCYAKKTSGIGSFMAKTFVHEYLFCTKKCFEEKN